MGRKMAGNVREEKQAGVRPEWTLKVRTKTLCWIGSAPRTSRGL